MDDDIVAMFAAGLYCYDAYTLIYESRGTSYYRCIAILATIVFFAFSLK